jgi:hypothetical protein
MMPVSIASVMADLRSLQIEQASPAGSREVLSPVHARWVAERGGNIMAELDARQGDTPQCSTFNTGQAPHYTELARDLGLTMEAGKRLLHALISSGIPAWLHPDTDYLVSFAPFHSLPTQYRVTIDGEQKWFAQ